MTPPASCGVLAVVDDWPVEAARVLEGAAHEGGVADGRAVVAEADAAGARQARRARPAACPARPLVTQPMGRTRTDALDRLLQDELDVARLSIAGSVLGMAQTVVKPPRAAAFVPVSIVSLYSKPGSRRCVCRSTKPGVTSRPRASKTRAPGASMTFSTRATTPILDQEVAHVVDAVGRVEHPAAANDEAAHRMPLPIR